MLKSKSIVVAIFLLSSAVVADEDAPKKKFSLQDLIQNASSPSSEPTTVAGVRGLEETNGKVDTKARDYAAIERLDHFVVHPEELNAFLAEGKLK
jgi:hypothetical protein